MTTSALLRPDVLVLAGGGIVGEAWMQGLLAGVEDAAGVDYRTVERFVGTSAGSTVATRPAPRRRPPRRRAPRPGARGPAPRARRPAAAKSRRRRASPRPPAPTVPGRSRARGCRASR